MSIYSTLSAMSTIQRQLLEAYSYTYVAQKML